MPTNKNTIGRVFGRVIFLLAASILGVFAYAAGWPDGVAMGAASGICLAMVAALAWA